MIICNLVDRSYTCRHHLSMFSFIRADLAQLSAYNTAHTNTAHTDTALIQAQPPDRLDANENPYDLPDELTQKLAEMWQQMASNRYPDGGHGALKSAIGDYVSELAPVTPEQISVGNGSDELIQIGRAHV